MGCIKKSFLFLFILHSSMSYSLTRNIKRVEGKFVKITWGDYQQLTIEKEGKELNFWCATSTSPSCDELDAKSASYKGKTLLIEYETLQNFVPEVGSKIKQDTIISVQLKQP